MSRAYFWVATILAVYCWLIPLAWLVAPSVPLTSWGLDIEPVAAWFGLRASVGTAGFGLDTHIVTVREIRKGPVMVFSNAITDGLSEVG